MNAIAVQVRFPPDQLAVLDEWTSQQPDAPSRPEAVRRLVALSLKPEK